MKRANYECDLHTHTTRSDGSDTPQESIDRAAALGLKVLAITDHDIRPPETICEAETGDEIDVCAYAKSKGVMLIRGTEISCETEVEDVHIVCFGCDWDDPYFSELENMVILSKIESYQLLVERLNTDGIHIDWKEVLDNNGNPVTAEHVQKKMIFELIARKGYTTSWSEAKLMVKNTSQYQINRRKPDPLDVIRQVRRCGGYTILAHPFLISEEVHVSGNKFTREQYIERLIGVGLDGIEATYTYDKTSYDGTMNKAEIEGYIKSHYTSKVKIISGGSDYHADFKKGVTNHREIGECGVTLEYLKNNTVLRTLISES